MGRWSFFAYWSSVAFRVLEKSTRRQGFGDFLFTLYSLFVFATAFCCLLRTLNLARMAGRNAQPKLRKPVFVKVDQLQPGTIGHTVTVKVLSAKTVLNRARPDVNHKVRIAECLVGDETGVIVFTARNEQVDMMKVDATVILRNARIDMYKSCMRLAVDKWGRIEVTEPADFVVKEDNNLSTVEYELVSVVDG